MTDSWINGYRTSQRRPVELLTDEVYDSQVAPRGRDSWTASPSAGLRSLDSLGDGEVKDAMLALPEGQRMAVFYVDVEGFRYEETAFILNVPVGTVMSCLHRGGRRLHILLSDKASSRRHRVAQDTRAANKHASLGITPDRYRVVHTHLFAAIVEVLGSAVTEEVAAAWDEVFWHMADSLIAAEVELYESVGAAPGEVWRTVRVRHRFLQSADTASFVLASLDGAPLPSFKAGQYLSVAVSLPDGARQIRQSRQIRQYSLTSAPTDGDWRISVKRASGVSGSDDHVAGPGEVSNHLYNHVFEGDVLDVTTPFGELVLREGDEPLLLISAGIGCTPMIGMLNHLADVGSARTIDVLHADRTPAAHAQRAELIDLVAKLPGAQSLRWYEAPGRRDWEDGVHAGRVNLDHVTIAPDVRAYLCGPLLFMASVRDALIARRVPSERIYYEVFGPGDWVRRAS